MPTSSILLSNTPREKNRLIQKVLKGFSILFSLRGLIFVIAIGTIYFRQPAFFSQPRFWAEEGTIYFTFALHYPWYYVLITPHPGYGYYSLLNNAISVLAANLVPLEFAPLITTIVAFAIQIIPLGIVLWGQSELCNTISQRLLAVLIILFTLSTNEVWLNTTNSHFYLLLIVCLILVDRLDDINIFKKWTYRLLLVLAGLTSPTVALLTLLFGIKAWVEKKPEYIRQTIILSLTTFIQVLSFLWSLQGPYVASERFSSLDPSMLPYIIWSRTFVTPLTGFQNAHKFVTASLELQDANYQAFVLYGILLFILTILLLSILIWPLKYGSKLLLVSAYCLITIFAIFTSATHGNKAVLIQPDWSSRYFYVPSVLLFMLILSAIPLIKQHSLLRIRSGICIMLVAISIGVGLTNYRQNLNFSTEWPSWREEVAKYRASLAYRELKIWPPGWSVKINEP